VFAKRINRVSASPTQQVTLEVHRLKQKGIDVIDLGAGEPDFLTPEHIRVAGIDAINKGFTKYTPNTGIKELKAAICSWYQRNYGVKFEHKETLVSAGGKQALFNVTMALCGSGDEVITHAPGWPTIVDQVKLADAKPVVVRTYPEHKFSLDASSVLNAVTARTKAIIINSPGNPTGSLVSEESLAAIADKIRKHNIWIVLDLCYEQLLYDNVPHNLVRVLSERMRDKSVFVGSLSKSYAMTGWRCGWTLGPSCLIDSCSKIQSHSTSNASSISQYAGVVALTGDQDCLKKMRDEYRSRRDQVLSWLSREQRLRCVCPGGAFYLFPDVSEFLSPDGIRTSTEFSEALLNHSHVAVTGGEAFDSPGFLRISYAASIQRLHEGVKRMLEFIGELDRGEIALPSRSF